MLSWILECTICSFLTWSLGVITPQKLFPMVSGERKEEGDFYYYYSPLFSFPTPFLSHPLPLAHLHETEKTDLQINGIMEFGGANKTANFVCSILGDHSNSAFVVSFFLSFSLSLFLSFSLSLFLSFSLSLFFFFFFFVPLISSSFRLEQRVQLKFPSLSIAPPPSL